MLRRRLLFSFSAPARKRIAGRGSGGVASIAVSLSGAAAGDFMLIAVSGFSVTPSIAGGDGGWIWVDPTSPSVSLGYFKKLLTSGDISAGSVTVSVASGSIFAFWVAYKAGGPTAAAFKTKAANTSGGTTLTLPAFSRAPNSGSVVLILMEAGAAGGITPAANWNADLTCLGGTNGGGFYSLDADNYNDGTVTFTGFGNTGDQYGYLVELTG
jgi:hypothetical protein